MAFEADSPDEVIDFLAAYVCSLGPEAREAISAQIVVVEDLASWRALAARPSGLVLVPPANLYGDQDLAEPAMSGRHHVLVRAHPLAGRERTADPLPRSHALELVEALEKIGFPRADAEHFARECRGSLTVLKRMLGQRHGRPQPEWSQGEHARALIPALLAGAWDDACPADCAMLERLAGRPYADVLATATEWIGRPDPPVMRIGSRFGMLSREDSWVLLAPRLTRVDLDTFEQVALDVLGEENPRYELAPSERWMAAARGKAMAHSENLRRGIAETLALLGGMSDTGVVNTPITPAQRAARVVRRLLDEHVGWRRWASLSPYLPLLAEAAPESFLDAVDRDLRAPHSQVVRLFEQEGGGLFPSSPHTGLLWAFENLAWHPDYLATVVCILARLASTDPGGQMGNRPLSSLRAILLPWLPQTTAPWRQRMYAMDAARSECPDVVWRLKLSLVPGHHDASMAIHRPAYRDWARAWRPEEAARDFWPQVKACVDWLVAAVGWNVERWVQLMEKLHSISPLGGKELLDRLSAIEPAAIPPDDRRRLADAIRETVAKHRQFADAHWALPQEELEELERALNQLQPDDPVARHAWLFANNPALLDETRGERCSSSRPKLAAARARALKEVIADGKVESAIALARAAPAPAQVGIALAETGLVKEEAILPGLLASDENALSELASGYISRRFKDSGWEWVSGLALEDWSDAEVVALAQALPFERSTWELTSRSEEAANAYWRTVQVLPWGWDIPPQDRAYAVKMLIEHGRPFDAVPWLGCVVHANASLDGELVMQTLEAGLIYRPEGDMAEAAARFPGSEVRDLFESLQKQQGVDRDRLARLEWAYLPLLDGVQGVPRVLHERLASSPEFFTEVICSVYRPASEPEEDRPAPSEEERLRALNAFRLLWSWQTLPGSGEGIVDEAALCVWVKRARELCREQDRLAVCDLTIGGVLAHAPAGKDGVWPCVAVRNVLEDFGTDKMAEGFKNGIYNKRGVVLRSLTEGGRQERELAAQYHRWAHACGEWPRTERALREVAKQYEEDARREDEQAAQRM